MQHNEDKITLNVPSYRQTKDYTCVPSCCKMILDYMNNVVLTIPESNISEDDIAKEMNTTISGTRFTEVENINKVMTVSNPSLEFIAEFKQHTLGEIKTELREERPVSVWIDTGSVNYLHSIVITGFDDTNKTISYNDPTYGKDFTITQSQFLSAWEKVVRGLKKNDSPLIDGYQIYHNYIRPHMSLDGFTPSEKCGIKINGTNKWITLIQNARKVSNCK